MKNLFTVSFLCCVQSTFSRELGTADLIHLGARSRRVLIVRSHLGEVFTIYDRKKDDDGRFGGAGAARDCEEINVSKREAIICFFTNLLALAGVERM